jgi:retinol dehydrogenase-14
MRPFMASPGRGAETPVYLASSPDAEGVTGQYFAKQKPKRSNPTSYDTAATARLWKISAGLVGLPFDAAP